MSTYQNGQTGEEVKSEPLPEPRYAFYDKNRDSINNGWVWFHRELSLDDLQKFYNRFKRNFGNDIPTGRGFTVFGGLTVFYQYFDGGQDDKVRDHWVLLTAWLPGDAGSRHTEILDNSIFNQVKDSDGAENSRPKGLSPHEYDVRLGELTYEGGVIENIKASQEKAKQLLNAIRARGAVDITFYCAKPDGTIRIETAKKSSGTEVKKKVLSTDKPALLLHDDHND